MESRLRGRPWRERREREGGRDGGREGEREKKESLAENMNPVSSFKCFISCHSVYF